ncbi:MAG TPA: Ig-like domain-containing domain [Hanamia sp.]|nr:Ig-like domain-containing domain [Hanamia sp.]
MKIYNSIIILLAVGFCYLLSIMGSGCAQIGMPTGGPRDTIPPVLLNANPPNKTVHFDGNRITFTFDEYVHLQDLQKYLLVAPEPKIIPNITSKLKTVSIRIRDTLQANTTYSFQFGDALQDINENNPIHNFTYVFSTGSYIDSLTFSGNVVLAETGKVDSTMLVFLYKNLDDSAVYKQKPRYVARLDSAGKFQFRYLAAGTYHLYALKDESGQKMYNNPSQLFAFADSVIHISNHVTPVELFAYVEEKNTKPTTNTGAAIKKNPEKTLKYTTSLSNNVQDLLTPLKINFQVPLKNYDSTKIHLTDTLYHPVQTAAILIDTTFKQITVKNNWIEDTRYKLVIDKDFAIDTLGDELKKPDTLSFKTKAEREYGSLKLNFTNLQKIAHPVLQFVQNNEIVDSFKITSPTLTIKLFNPGDYELRILNDENENGTWDPGNYHLKKQPEKVIAIPKKISIRADWDNESNVEL